MSGSGSAFAVMRSPPGHFLRPAKRNHHDDYPGLACGGGNVWRTAVSCQPIFLVVVAGIPYSNTHRVRIRPSTCNGCATFIEKHAADWPASKLHRWIGFAQWLFPPEPAPHVGYMSSYLLVASSCPVLGGADGDHEPAGQPAEQPHRLRHRHQGSRRLVGVPAQQVATIHKPIGVEVAR